MRILTALLFLSSLSAWAQYPSVAISKEPSAEAVTTFTYLDASSNPQYICKALSRQPTFTWAVTPSSQQGTLTNIVVSSNVGTVTVSANHGLDTTRALGNLVTVAGSTTAALNGSYAIQTIGSTTTFTITTSGVSDGTYSTAALAISTQAPRITAAIWSIERFTYSSSAVVGDQWATTISSGQGGSTAKIYICNNRTTLAYE